MAHPYIDSACQHHDHPVITLTNVLGLLYYHHHHQAAVVSHGWAKASTCRLQVSLSCAVLCHIMSLQYFVQVVSQPLGWSHLFCCVHCLHQVVTCEVHQSSFRPFDVPCLPRTTSFFLPFKFADYIYDLLSFI